MGKTKLASMLAAIVIALPASASAATTPTPHPSPQACPDYNYSHPVSAPVLVAMRVFAKKHGFTVRSARMTRPAWLALYTTIGTCQGKYDIQHLVKVPASTSELRFVLAKIRYPGTDGQQPSPGTPYFVMAKIDGSWRVIKNEMIGDDFGF